MIMKKKITFKGIWKVLKNCISGFSDDKITKLSASLAYYTVFSLGPLLIVVVFLASIFFGREAVEGSIYGQIQSFVGTDTALQLQDMIKNAAISGKGNLAAIIGVITLLIGATTVFAEMQDSINSIWGLKAKPKTGWVKLIIDRLLSFGVVASLGFLLLVSLGISALIESLNNSLKARFPDAAITILYISNLLITFIVITALFSIIFKVLPDAKIRWKDILSGAITTAVLFMIGKFAISFYISKSDVGSTYGAAGSLVVLLVWVYYSAIILYFGAEFTKAFAMEYGNAIHPNSYAVISKKVEVENGKDSVQNAEKKIEKKQNLSELELKKRKP
jgi:membrane protein